MGETALFNLAVELGRDEYRRNGRHGKEDDSTELPELKRDRVCRGGGARGVEALGGACDR